MPQPPYMADLPAETRVGEPTFDPEVAKLYVRALRALDDRGVPFLVGGALALNLHTGIWRDTKDLDVFVEPAVAPRALEALEAVGLTTAIVYESWLGKGWEGDVFVDVIWRNANAKFPVERAWFARAARARILGQDVRVLAAEELILSKIMVGGRQRFDGADVLHVLHQQAERLDWTRLLDGAGEQVELLLGYLHWYRWGYPAWRDRVPDRVIEEAERRAREVAQRGETKYRALLLDLQSFRVDVEAWGMPDPHKEALADIFGSWEGRQ